MDRAYIDKHHLVDLYVQGKLAGDNLTEFEIYVLQHSEIVDDIEFARGMRDALGDSKDMLIANDANAAAGGTSGFWFGRRYAVAATILLGVSTLFSTALFMQVGNLQKNIADLRNPSVIADVLVFETMRGDPTPVTRQSTGGAIIVSVDVSGSDATSYFIDLSDDASGFHWAQSQVRTDDKQMIHLLLPSLPAGEYLLSVRADGNPTDTTPAAKYPFSLQVSGE